MTLGYWQSLLLGLVSGLTELLPVSAPAHRALLLRMLGQDSAGSVMILFLHAGALLALYQNLRGQIRYLNRQRRLAALPKRRRRREPDRQSVLELRLLRSACLPMLALILLFGLVRGWFESFPVISVILILNGILLYLPSRLPTGNKNAHWMTRLDALLMGLAAGLGGLPGFSTLGAAASVAQIRGADRQKSLNWALLMTLPALLAWMLLDGYGIVTAAAGGGLGIEPLFLLRCVLAMAAAWAGAYGAILLLRFLSFNLGFSGFAYYSWGAALFTFILYLTT